MLRGKSLACCPWPAVMDLPSEVHVHSYRGSCTEIVAGSKPFIATGAAPRLSQCHDLEKLCKIRQDFGPFSCYMSQLSVTISIIFENKKRPYT